MRKHKKFLLKAKVVFRDNWLLLSIIFLWFWCGFLVYFCAFKMDWGAALRAALFLKHTDYDFSGAYAMWSQGLIFGAVFSFLFHNILEKYNPERGCRMMAKEMKGHIVVIGYSHLGKRMVDYLKTNKIPYCLIEKDKDAIDDLLRQGEPVVVDNATEVDALLDANIAGAKAVIIASNNLETALLVTKRVREHNNQCPLIARCFQDEFAEILESLGATEVISSSKNAFDNIVACLKA